MNTYEDDEFERIERENKIRETSPIPIITDEEWEALNEEE